MLSGPDLPKRLQDLTPGQARFCLDAHRFARENAGERLTPGSTVLAGFSHGPDSTALLLALYYLRKRLDIHLVACHLDHGLRPSSAEEAKRASAFCAKLGIECRLGAADVAALAKTRGIGAEEAGRIARYAFFARIKGETGASLICLGHQSGDLCEDVLMRLTRGAGWPGLGGMAAFDPKRGILRPLLAIPKSRILDFLASLGADFVRDESNQGLDCLRNRMRHEVVPRLARENPAFGEAVAKLWQLARLDESYWEQTTGPIIEAGAGQGKVAIEAAVLAISHPALRLRLYKAALDRLGPGESLADTIFELDRAFATGRTGRTFQFPGGKLARLTSQGIEFLLVAPRSRG